MTREEFENNQKIYDEATDLYLSAPEIGIEDFNEEMDYVKLIIPKELDYKGEMLTAKEVAEKLKPLFKEKIYFKEV